MKAKNSTFKIWLGAFVVLGLALFIGGIFIIGKQKNMFNPVFKLSSQFKNVSGLQVGNKVRFSGINVGTVERIAIKNDTTVLVEMLIRQEINQFIKTDCQTSIGSEGLIGDKVINISQSEGNFPEVKASALLRSSEPIELDAIMASIQLTADNTVEISNNTVEITDNTVDITREISEIVHNINKGKGTLAQLIRDPTMANNLSQTMVNLKKSTKGLDESVEAAKDNFLLRGFFKRKAKKAQEKKEKEELLKEEKATKKTETKKEKK